MQITDFTLDRLPEVARTLLDSFPKERFFAFYGKMGAGKTTLIKELCARLGVLDTVCSPTFAIVNSYTTDGGEWVYHFDFYRLKNIDEAFDIGYEEYFYSGHYCFSEWTEKIEPILPDHYVKVLIEEHDQLRTLTATLETNNSL